MVQETPISLPAGSTLKQDLGFQGHLLEDVVVEQPYKKPKNKELTFAQKLYNKLFSATRVVVEHANSGIKRLRIVKDKIRIKSTYIRDKVMAIATAIHNLRVVSPYRDYNAIKCAIKINSE